MAETLVVVPIILIVAFTLGELFRRVGFPSVVGQILAGMILGFPIIESLLFGNPSTFLVIDFLSVLGIVFLLFLAGLEIRFEKVRESSKDSILISLSSAVVPFLFGFVFLRALGYDFLMALVFGGALMVTAEGTKVKVLMDLNALDTKLGAIMLAAGAIDDIFEVMFLSFIVVLGHGGSFTELAMIPLQLAVFLVVAFVFFKASSKILCYLEKNGGDETELFSMVIIFILVLAALSEALRVGYLIGAIIGGFLLQISMKDIHPQHKEDMVKVTKMITLAFVVPFFFVNVGLKFNIETLFVNMPLLVGTIIIAFIGTILGALVVKPFSSLSLKQLYYVGWAMNSRGAAELVIALLALQFQLITPEVFSALVITAVITTFTFPFVLARGIKRNPGLMEGTHLGERK